MVIVLMFVFVVLAHVRVCARMLVRTTAVRVPALVVAAHVVLLVLLVPVLLVLLL